MHLSRSSESCFPIAAGLVPPRCLCKWQRGAFGSEAEKICGKPLCLALKWKRFGSRVAVVVSNVKSHLPKGTSDFPPYAFSTWSRLLVMAASWSLHWICVQLCSSADVALEETVSSSWWSQKQNDGEGHFRESTKGLPGSAALAHGPECVSLPLGLSSKVFDHAAVMLIWSLTQAMWVFFSFQAFKTRSWMSAFLHINPSYLELSDTEYSCSVFLV